MLWGFVEKVWILWRFCEICEYFVEICGDFVEKARHDHDHDHRIKGSELKITPASGPGRLRADQPCLLASQPASQPASLPACLPVESLKKNDPKSI